MKNKKPLFNIGDKIYHVIPESRPGIVVDVCYYFSTEVFQYMVAFSETEQPLWYTEYELSKDRRY